MINMRMFPKWNIMHIRWSAVQHPGPQACPSVGCNQWLAVPQWGTQQPASECCDTVGSKHTYWPQASPAGMPHLALDRRKRHHM